MPELKITYDDKTLPLKKKKQVMTADQFLKIGESICEILEIEPFDVVAIAMNAGNDSFEYLEIDREIKNDNE